MVHDITMVGGDVIYIKPYERGGEIGELKESLMGEERIVLCVFGILFDWLSFALFIARRASVCV